MTRINLLPWREQERKIQLIYFAALMAAFVVMSLFFVLILHFYFKSVIHYRQERNDFLQAQITQAQDELGVLGKKQEEELKLQSDLKFIIGLRNKSFTVVYVLDELAKRAPSSISLTKIIKNNANITIEGLAQSDTEITFFMKNLAKSLAFDQPVLTGIAAQKEGDRTVKFFQLKIVQKEQDANG